MTETVAKDYDFSTSGHFCKNFIILKKSCAKITTEVLFKCPSNCSPFYNPTTMAILISEMESLVFSSILWQRMFLMDFEWVQLGLLVAFCIAPVNDLSCWGKALNAHESPIHNGAQNRNKTPFIWTQDLLWEVWGPWGLRRFWAYKAVLDRRIGRNWSQNSKNRKSIDRGSFSYENQNFSKIIK